MPEGDIISMLFGITINTVTINLVLMIKFYILYTLHTLI